jgi:hypothetical protein
MRVMGKSKLSWLANGGAADVSGPSRAFLAELAEARWRSVREAKFAYPAAEIEAHRLIIPFGAGYCIVLAINYELGLALIEYAGVRMERSKMFPTTRVQA